MNKALVLLGLMLVAYGCDNGADLVAPGEAQTAWEYASIEGRRGIDRDEIMLAIQAEIYIPLFAFYFADVAYLEYSLSKFIR